MFNISSPFMESYAIVQASGKQIWVEENRFYNLNRLPLNSGDHFSLNKILLVKQNNSLHIGKPFLLGSYSIEATVVRHFLDKKTCVYKMRPKKKTRKTFGNRSKKTKIFIRSINSI